MHEWNVPPRRTSMLTKRSEQLPGAKPPHQIFRMGPRVEHELRGASNVRSMQIVRSAPLSGRGFCFSSIGFALLGLALQIGQQDVQAIESVVQELSIAFDPIVCLA